MEEIKFKSITDLYRRVYPALKTKKEEINIKYKANITEIDIWNYLKTNIWNQTKNLSLCDMVNEILNIDGDKIYFYIKNNSTRS